MNIIGVDIGGTKCTIVKADAEGRPLEERRFATTTVGETLEEIYSAITALGPGEEPVFGIACGGPLNAAQGVILSPPNLPDWDHVHITDELTHRFGGRAFLMKDANACALAEWQFGAGRGAKNVVFLTYGTGMGAGLILDGRLYEGASGDAGEVGHLRLAPDGPIGYGKAGSFEGFCSGSGLSRLAAGRIPGHPSPSAKELAELAASGCPEALAIWEESSRRLGQALAVIVDFFNPEVIILGSIYVRSGHLLETGMRGVLEAEALPSALAACRIVPAELGERTGIMSAIAVATYHLALQ